MASDGSAVEIDDFAPRFLARGRVFRPAQIVRRIRPISGRPRIRVVVRPRFGWGEQRPQVTSGSNHVRYVSDAVTLAPLHRRADHLTSATRRISCSNAGFNFFLGPDESLSDRPGTLGREFQEETEYYWKRWTLRLGLPLEWQEAVIRAAITLKLCTFEETGAIVRRSHHLHPRGAVLVPQLGLIAIAGCVDAFFVVRALNALSDPRDDGELPHLHPRHHRDDEG